MNIFIIVYDLNATGKDYKNLYAALDVLKAVRAQDSMFILKTSLTLLEVVNRLNQHIDKNDFLFVSPLSKNAGGQMLPDFWAWFNAL